MKIAEESNQQAEWVSTLRQNDARLRVVDIRSLWNQRLIWIIIATDLLLHAQRFLSQW